MKRNKSSITVLIFVLLLTGCRGDAESENVNTEEENIVVEMTEEQDTESIMSIIERDVVFLTEEISIAKTTAALTRNMMWNCYDVVNDTEALYGFKVNIDHYFDGRYKSEIKLSEDYVYREAADPVDYPVQEENETDADYWKRCSAYKVKTVREALLQEGLYLCILESKDIIVVGTIEKLERVFKDMDNLKGWCIEADPVVYPNINKLSAIEGKQMKVKVSLIALNV